MSKTKKLLCISGVCIIIGLAIVVVCLLLGKTGSSLGFFDGKLSFNSEEEYNTVEEFEYANKIKVDLDNFEVQLKPSENDNVKVDCTYYSDKQKPDISFENNELSVIQKDKKVFIFNLFFWKHDAEKLTIYVPVNKEYENISITTNNGEIQVLGDIKAGTINCNTKNGKVFIENATVNNTFFVKSSNGKIECNGSFKGNNSIETSNGVITVNGKFDGVNSFDTSNGKVELNGSYKGTTTVETSNGAIEASINEKISNINLECSTSNGHIYINDNKLDKYYTNKLDNSTNNKDSINLHTSNGRIKVKTMQ